jgi:hypothetical protein
MEIIQAVMDGSWFEECLMMATRRGEARKNLFTRGQQHVPSSAGFVHDKKQKRYFDLFRIEKSESTSVPFKTDEID